MTPHQELDARILRLRAVALGIGVVAAVVCAIGGVLMPVAFFHAYLTAYLFWLDIALGSLGLIMLHHITGGAWGFTVRRLLEAAMMTLPLMAVLFVPLVFGLHALYPWARPEQVAADPVLRHREALFTPLWFIGRAVIYFAIWIGLAVVLRRWSVAQDRTGDPVYMRRFQAMAGPGLILYAFAASLAAIDWIMALEPHWFSTIFGMLVLVGQALAAMAWAIVCAEALAGRRLLKSLAPASAWQDTGGMTIAFVLMWAYMAYSQYIIIWSGDLPHETSFFVHRRAGAWAYVALVMMIIHFFLPFFLLLFGGLKRNTVTLAMIAWVLLAAHLVNEFWTVAPSWRTHGLTVTWLDLLLPVAIGGLWIAAFAASLHGRPLVPLHDPRLVDDPDAAHAREALGYG
jgi:hypothetical protein